MASIISAGTTSGTSLNLSGDTSGVLQLASNGSTTAVTVDTSQNVGIGTASPGAKLSLTSTGNTTADGVRLTFGSEARPHNIYSDLSTGRDLLIAPYRTVTLKSGSGTTEGEVRLQSYESTIISTGSSYTERMRVPAAGGVQVVTCVSVGNATPANSGAGITFPASQSASSDANTLDDYEEGTWTPVIGGEGGESGQSYSGQEGHYTKIGRVVTVTFRVVLSAKGTITGNTAIKGLPFTSQNSITFAAGVALWDNLAVNWAYLFLKPVANTTYAVVEGTKSAASATTPTTTTDIANNTQFNGSLTYFV
jgi:hypothetical protein